MASNIQLTRPGVVIVKSLVLDIRCFANKLSSKGYHPRGISRLFDVMSVLSWALLAYTGVRLAEEIKKERKKKGR